jgi:hypothetical protein
MTVSRYFESVILFDPIPPLLMYNQNFLFATNFLHYAAAYSLSDFYHRLKLRHNSLGGPCL